MLKFIPDSFRYYLSQLKELYNSRRIFAEKFNLNLRIKTRTVCFKFLGFKLHFKYTDNYYNNRFVEHVVDFRFYCRTIVSIEDFCTENYLKTNFEN